MLSFNLNARLACKMVIEIKLFKEVLHWFKTLEIHFFTFLPLSKLLPHFSFTLLKHCLCLLVSLTDKGKQDDVSTHCSNGELLFHMGILLLWDQQLISSEFLVIQDLVMYAL